MVKLTSDILSIIYLLNILFQYNFNFAFFKTIYALFLVNVSESFHNFFTHLYVILLTLYMERSMRKEL